VLVVYGCGVVSILAPSVSVHALMVVVRMLPMLPTHRRITIKSSSLGISVIMTKSYFPAVQSAGALQKPVIHLL
jgi:hypothetical protein